MFSVASLITRAKQLTYVALLAFVSLTAAAASPSQAAGYGNPGSMAVVGSSYATGTVRNEKGEGIGEVVVSAGNVEAVTGFNGDYKLGPLPAGEYTLKLRDPARRYIKLDNPRLAPKFSVASNSSVSGVDATLKYAPKAVGRITGEVRGASSERQATTYVDAYLIDADHYYNVATSMVRGGKYSFARLPEGEYVVRASSYQFASGEYQRAYYHDGQSDGEASVVNLRVAEELSSVNVFLDSSAHAQLAGQVLDHEGEPLRAITVTLLGMKMLEWQTVTTDDEGRFHMQGIAPDRYRLQFKDPKGRYESTYLDSKDFFTSSAMELTDGETEAVTTRLSSTGKVQGTIDLTQEEPGRVVFFVDVYKEQSDGEFARVATKYLREAGDFTVSGVPSGDVRVAVRAYNRTTRSSTVSYHLGGKSVEESPGIPVSPEQDANDVQFYVSI